MSQAERDRAFQLGYKWMADHADKSRGGSKLQPASWHLGRWDEARAANRRALELTANPAEQALLRGRIDWGDDAG
jgi:hypothetical protein